MQHWLICFSAALPEAARLAILSAAGAQLTAPDDAVPLGAEVAVPVEADATAVATLRRHAQVRGVFPNSELTLY